MRRRTPYGSPLAGSLAGRAMPDAHDLAPAPDLTVLIGGQAASSGGTTALEDLVAGVEDEVVVTLRNDGSATLAVTAFDLAETTNVQAASDFEGPLELEPDATADVTIALTPTTYGAVVLGITIASDDPGTPYTRTLAGEAASDYTPPTKSIRMNNSTTNEFLSRTAPSSAHLQHDDSWTFVGWVKPSSAQSVKGRLAGVGIGDGWRVEPQADNTIVWGVAASSWHLLATTEAMTADAWNPVVLRKIGADPANWTAEIGRTPVAVTPSSDTTPAPSDIDYTGFVERWGATGAGFDAFRGQIYNCAVCAGVLSDNEADALLDLLLSPADLTGVVSAPDGAQATTSSVPDLAGGAAFTANNLDADDLIADVPTP